MPKLSVYLRDDVYKLVEKEIEDNPELYKGRYVTSAAISALIQEGSKYEIKRTVEFKRKEDGE